MERNKIKMNYKRNEWKESTIQESQTFESRIADKIQEIEDDMRNFISDLKRRDYSFLSGVKKALDNCPDDSEDSFYDACDNNQNDINLLLPPEMKEPENLRLDTEESPPEGAEEEKEEILSEYGFLTARNSLALMTKQRLQSTLAISLQNNEKQNQLLSYVKANLSEEDLQQLGPNFDGLDELTKAISTFFEQKFMNKENVNE